MHNQCNSFNEVQAKKHDMDPLRPCHAPLCSNNPLQIFSLPQLIKSDLNDYEGEGKKQEREKGGDTEAYKYSMSRLSLTHVHTDAEFRQPVLLRTGVTR